MAAGVPAPIVAGVRPDHLRGALALGGRVAPGPAARVAEQLFSRPRRHPKRPWELALAERAEPLVLAGGLRALAWGEGPVVLLVHGWSGRGTQLAAFVEPLVAAGHRVLALDGSAHGDSPGRLTNLPAFADALRAVGVEYEPLPVVTHRLADVVDLAAGQRPVLGVVHGRLRGGPRPWAAAPGGRRGPRR